MHNKSIPSSACILCASFSFLFLSFFAFMHTRCQVGRNDVLEIAFAEICTPVIVPIVVGKLVLEGQQGNDNNNNNSNNKTRAVLVFYITSHLSLCPHPHFLFKLILPGRRARRGRASSLCGHKPCILMTRRSPGFALVRCTGCIQSAGTASSIVLGTWDTAPHLQALIGMLARQRGAAPDAVQPSALQRRHRCWVCVTKPAPSHAGHVLRRNK